MKVLIIAVGTRGDVEPFLAVAEMLKGKGHEVLCVFPEQFRNLAADSDVEFNSLSPKFIELIESEDGKMAMGGKGSVFRKVAAYARLYRKSAEVNTELFSQQRELVEQHAPDRIVHSGKAIYPMLWGISNPNRSTLISPVPCLIQYVKDRPHVGFNRDYGPFLNKLTYSLANFALVKHVSHVAKKCRWPGRVTPRQIKDALLNQKIAYTVSPSIFARPDYWPKHARVFGYYQRSSTRNWEADDSLIRFLDRHGRIVLITFGSMTNPDPAEKTRVILDILERNRIAAIINTASGGLTEPEDYDRNSIHFVPEIPYDWILPRVHAVVHHGGSGTTHMSLKYGCAAMIIPHIIDQFLWNTLISDKGVGPKGISIKSFSKQLLEPRLLDLFTTKAYRRKAEDLAAEMGKEKLDDLFYEVLSS